MKKHIPNIITSCNLISGCIATYWAFQGDYQLALLFIVIGAAFDFCDGMSARLLHTYLLLLVKNWTLWPTTSPSALHPQPLSSVG